MPLTLPNLDDRRWTDLTDEARALIPTLAPSWTDQNPSEPGTTLIELLAYVTELDLYQLNRIAKRQRRLMLALAGETTRGREPARALLRFDSRATAPAAVASGTESVAGALRFRTLEPLVVFPAAVAALLSSEDGVLRDLSSTLQRQGRAWIFGPEARHGAALLIGLDSVAVAGEVSLGFHFAGTRTDAIERARIPAPELARHHDVQLLWEVSTTAGWLQLAVVDETRALTLDGVLRLALPNQCAAVAIGAFAPRCYLRCTLASGSYDRPPELSQVFLNAVVAEQVTTSVSVPVGSSSGEPFQSFKLPGAPVIGETLELGSQEGAALRQWQRVDDLVASRPGDAHFLLDEARGEVQLGDGNRGRLAAFGSTFIASYRSTQGSAGRVAAGAVSELAVPVPDLSVTNPAPSQGGEDAETLLAALARAAEDREAALRAITVADIQQLVLETPGALVARAEVLPNTFPSLRCLEAHGVVTVVVLPDAAGHRPLPSPGLLALVTRRLEPTRIVGTRFVVVGPNYIEVSVSASVKGKGVLVDELRERIVAALDCFFHPLLGGPSRTGWQLGRDVYRAEVLQLLDAVPGVEYVAALELSAAQCAPSCGNLCLEPLALAASGVHRIEVV